MRNISKINGLPISGKVLPEIAVGNLVDAKNGLSSNGSVVILGGSIIQDTVIDNPNSKLFTISGAKFIGDGSGLTGVSGGGGVPQTTSPNRTYVTTSSGEQSYIPYSNTTPEGNAMVQYDQNGNVFVSDPLNNGHATSKSYVDNQVQNALGGGYLFSRQDNIFVKGGNDTTYSPTDISIPLPQRTAHFWARYEIMVSSVTEVASNIKLSLPGVGAGLTIKGTATMEGFAGAQSLTLGSDVSFATDGSPKTIIITLYIDCFPEGVTWGSLTLNAANLNSSDAPIQIYEGSRVIYREIGF